MYQWVIGQEHHISSYAANVNDKKFKKINGHSSI